MSLNSKIEWTESTWNPVTGCSKISEGCKNCYAEKLAIRLKAMGNEKYENGFKVTLHPDVLNDPLLWKKSSMIFVNSMSDLFHEEVPFEYIQAVFTSMSKAKQHTFQILTKREKRLLLLAPQLIWASNIWMGVSVENRRHVDRIDTLRSIPAAVRFISFEPLLEQIDDIDLHGISWAIVGGESGPSSRIMEPEWVLNLKQQCEKQDVLFYFKQWGGINKKANGRILLGKTWDDMPKCIVSQQQRII